MSTAARIYTAFNARFYYPDGSPCIEVPKAKGGGVTAPTIAHARKLKLLPSVTTIINILDKPNLVTWKIEQGVLAVETTPRLEGEQLDAFIHRVLHVEKVHEQEMQQARDLGTDIHDALANAMTEQVWDRSLSTYVEPVLEWQRQTGKVLWTEKALVGKGYAGRSDALLETQGLLLVDFKTTSKPPEKESWDEHRLQTSAYATALGNTGDKRLITCNVYISTKEPGNIAVFTQHDWADTYVNGFEPLLRYWMWANQYWPGKEGKK